MRNKASDVTYKKNDLCLLDKSASKNVMLTREIGLNGARVKEYTKSNRR